ncbi:MAG: hypothetical protein V1890_03815 [Candidatus Zixiibacteriota bacterium]
MKKTELAIGDSTELIVSYTSAITPGKIVKYANVFYKDTSSQVQNVKLNCQIVPVTDTTFKVQVSPPSLDFTVVQGKPQEKKLSLKNSDVVEYKVSLIDYPEEYFKVKLGKKLKPGKSVELKVKPVKDLPREGFKRSLTLELEGKEKTRISIPLVFNPLPATSTKK